MIERYVTIENRAGIHARPAAVLVTTATKFLSKIFLENNNERINGKSIMGVISLGATYKTTLKIIADGEDEKEAIEALEKLFKNKFE